MTDPTPEQRASRVTQHESINTDVALRIQQRAAFEIRAAEQAAREKATKELHKAVESGYGFACSVLHVGLPLEKHRELAQLVIDELKPLVEAKRRLGEKEKP